MAIKDSNISTPADKFIPKFFNMTFERPKFFDYIPASYLLAWEDPQEFLPKKMVEHFNEKMFLNFIHRECFKSCVSNSNSLTQDEKTCYDNCRNKHYSSLGTFKEIVMSKRYWLGWRNYISVKEYSRVPEEIGTAFPTDFKLKSEIKQLNDYKNEQNYEATGIRDLFGADYEKDSMSIFDLYMKGKYTENSNLEKTLETNKRPDIYTEYKELKNKYADQIKEILVKKTNMDDWKDIPGAKWMPDESEATEGGEEKTEEKTETKTEEENDS